MKESPIFSKTYDFVAWLIPLTLKFPRQQRFVMAQALQQETLRFQSLLIEAAHQRPPRERLIAADAELDKVRTHVRLCRDLEHIVEHASVEVKHHHPHQRDGDRRSDHGH